jgi:hypothetical protein
MFDWEALWETAGNHRVRFEVRETMARKPWTCETCGAEIKPGELYWNRRIRVISVAGEPFSSEHFCIEHKPALEPAGEPIRN